MDFGNPQITKEPSNLNLKNVEKENEDAKNNSKDATNPGLINSALVKTKKDKKNSSQVKTEAGGDDDKISKLFIDGGSDEVVETGDKPFDYSGKYRWTAKAKYYTNRHVHFKKKFLSEIDWSPYFFGVLFIITFILGFWLIVYYMIIGIYVIQTNLVGPKRSNFSD